MNLASGMPGPYSVVVFNSWFFLPVLCRSCSGTLSCQSLVYRRDRVLSVYLLFLFTILVLVVLVVPVGAGFSNPFGLAMLLSYWQPEPFTNWSIIFFFPCPCPILAVFPAGKSSFYFGLILDHLGTMLGLRSVLFHEWFGEKPREIKKSLRWFFLDKINWETIAQKTSGFAEFCSVFAKQLWVRGPLLWNWN